MNEVCFAGMEEFNEEVSSSEKSRIRIGRSASQSGTQKFGRCVREAHTRDPQRNRRPVPAGVLYHLRHPLLGLERIEHAKANGGRAHLGRKPSYTREQFDTVHAMLGGQTVGTCDDTVEAYNRARQSVRPARLMSDLLRVGEMLCTNLWTLRPPQPFRNCGHHPVFVGFREEAPLFNLRRSLCFQLADLKDVTAFDNLVNLARIANVNQRIGVRNHEVGEFAGLYCANLRV